ncbi:branched-chain amino acid ABC transporter permease [Candidatus Desulforudis audaxviator]|uniref:Inner-membrane translocator n=1 Tax=Desulforudis audaxviator (strain MP104C) TaxID=477974 RepID=B1I2G8_DESAP|nr:branched-chain amino acid ABC transporter permease [Candidatus Desulforudis audaxviator]ACA59204.1 inner-membrane translocator [Candidatus Desulforudis audaxviator MP104C]
MNYWAKNKNIILVLLVVTLFALFPLVVKSSYFLGIFVIAGLYSIVAVGLGLLLGYAGQVSFGQAAFYGLGAYTAAILSGTYGWPPLLALAAAPFLPAVVAAVIGRPILRLREHYLVLGTLGFGILVYILLKEFVGLTGGPSGYTGIPYLSIGGLVLNTDVQFFYLVWFFAFLTLVGAWNLVNSRIGRALRAIHGSEVAAEAAGIDTARLKLKVFILSAFLAGLAGGLYAFYITFVSPSPFGFHASIQFVLMAVVGGAATVWGPVVGAFVIVGLIEFLRWAVPVVLPKAGGEFEIIFFGIILVLVLLFRPEGILSHKRRRRLEPEAGKEAAETCST